MTPGQNKRFNMDFSFGSVAFFPILAGKKSVYVSIFFEKQMGVDQKPPLPFGS